MQLRVEHRDAVLGKSRGDSEHGDRCAPKCHTAQSLSGDQEVYHEAREQGDDNFYGAQQEGEGHVQEEPRLVVDRPPEVPEHLSHSPPPSICPEQVVPGPTLGHIAPPHAKARAGNDAEASHAAAGRGSAAARRDPRSQEP